MDHEGNKMTINNVAMIMAPNLFLVASGKKNKDKEVQFHMAAGTATVVRMLIKYQHILWTVSGNFLGKKTSFTSKIKDFFFNRRRIKVSLSI